MVSDEVLTLAHNADSDETAAAAVAARPGGCTSASLQPSQPRLQHRKERYSVAP
ncbi:MAG TPA: hypothetical protein VKE50_02115 [Thermoanaerobaculia bacterium]|nr:hypothetical protein [Thermoanaerobaculia bacterium]